MDNPENSLEVTVLTLPRKGAFHWPFGSDQYSLQNHVNIISLMCRDSLVLKAYEINPNNLTIYQEQTNEKNSINLIRTWSIFKNNKYSGWK